MSAPIDGERSPDAARDDDESSDEWRDDVDETSDVDDDDDEESGDDDASGDSYVSKGLTFVTPRIKRTRHRSAFVSKEDAPWQRMLDKAHRVGGAADPNSIDGRYFRLVVAALIIGVPTPKPTSGVAFASHTPCSKQLSRL